MACAASMQNELASLMFEEPPAMNCKARKHADSRGFCILGFLANQRDSSQIYNAYIGLSLSPMQGVTGQHLPHTSWLRLSP